MCIVRDGQHTLRLAGSATGTSGPHSFGAECGLTLVQPNLRVAAYRDTDGARIVGQMSFQKTTKAVVTDIHFLIPLIVLLIGVSLLIELH